MLGAGRPLASAGLTKLSHEFLAKLVRTRWSSCKSSFSFFKPPLISWLPNLLYDTKV